MAFDKWARKPNPKQTGIQFRKEALLHFLATGNNFIEIKYKNKNKNDISAITNINPAKIAINKTNEVINYYEYADENGAIITYNKNLDSSYENPIRYKFIKDGVTRIIALQRRRGKSSYK